MLLIALVAPSGCAFDPPSLDPGGPEGPGIEPGLNPGPEPVSPSTDPWWDERFSHRVRISFDNRGRTEALSDFPVLLTLDATRISYVDMLPNGVDVRFVDADGATELDYEIERFDDAGESFLWVRVPTIDANSDADYMYMYYGNPEAGEAPVDRGVWQPAGYMGVYHLSDRLTGGVDEILDSSGSQNHGFDRSFNGTGNGVLGPGRSSEEGAAARSVDFVSNSDRVEIDDREAFAVASGQARTMEVWFKASERNETRYIWYKEVGCRGWTIQLNANGELQANFGTTVTGSGICASNGFEYTELKSAPGTRFDDDEWHQAVFMVDRVNGVGTLHADGAPVASLPVPTDRLGVARIDAKIGHSFDDNNSFTGLIDETRISEGTRSDDWISAQYAAVAGGLVSYGSPELLP